MGEPIPTEGAPEVNPTPGVNPAWNDFLKEIPTEYHEKVTPVLKSWDDGVTNKIRSVQQQYDPYKAYEPFVQNQVSPEELQYGYGILQALQNDPVATVKAIQEAYNIQSDLLSQGQSETEPEVDPRFANLHPDIIAQLQHQQSTLETMGKLMLKQREEALAAAEAQKLDQQLKALKQQHGDFNEEAVLRLALQMGNDVPAALKFYTDTVNAELAKRNAPPAPRLLGSGGAAPDGGIDPRKLNRQQTVNLMADMLKANKGA